jgi:hypothetical protein
MTRRRFQFSLLRLLFVTAVIGSVLACFANFGLSSISLTIVWIVLLIVLMLAPLLALLGNESRRTFWTGFAWFGWIYVLLLLAGRPPVGGPSANNTEGVLRLPVLAINLGTRVLYERILPPESRTWSDDPHSDFAAVAAIYDTKPIGFGAGPGIGGAPAFGGPAGAGMPPAGAMPAAAPRRMISWELFRDFAHAVWICGWALLGGLLAWRLSRRTRVATSGGG